MRKKFVIIDGSSLIHRAFYALGFLSTKQGLHTNAVYGFTLMLLNIIGEMKPELLAVAFDKSKLTFRNELYDKYKANRSATPPELSEQFPLAKEISEAIGAKVIELEGYEADDIIGTLTVQGSEADYDVIVITGDRDALQLINSKVEVWLTKKGITDILKMDTVAVIEKYSVQPKNLIDIKGLAGDSSDNVPGVPGIGEKTAIKLISAYGTIENLLNNIAQVSGKKLQENLTNNRELALLSKILVTIKCDVPLGVSVTEFKMSPDITRLIALFSKLEFKSLLPRMYELLGQENLAEKAILPLPEIAVITLADEINVIIDKVKTEGIFYFYPAIVGQVPNLKLIGIAIALAGQTYYIQADINGWNSIMELLTDNEIKKVTYDAKNIYSVCSILGRNFGGLSFDIIVAAYLLNQTGSTYPISMLCKTYLGKVFQNETNKEATKEYCGWVVSQIKELHAVMLQKINEYKLTELYNNIEQPLIAVLSEMEITGIKVDAAKLKVMSHDIGEKIEVLLQEIYELAGTQFNVNSPKQLGVILFETLKLPVIKKTKIGYSTDVEVLEKLTGQHLIADKLLEYRLLTKLKSTYLDGLKPLIDPATGRIHTSFNQTVTATGRLSSSEPNLQNVPIRTEMGRKIRELFIPGEGYNYILAADYSQVELRILAHISEDTNLIDAFVHNQDIHTRTASEVFGVSLEAVTPEMRAKAKAVNFGIIYGISDYGLSRDLGITRKEAAQYIESYFSRCTGVKKFIENVVRHAHQSGYVATLYGRRRYLPDINSSNFNLRSFAERTAMNTPIQGTAADIIKKAMIDVHKALTEEKVKSRILLQVHDELVLEVKADEIKQVTEIVKQAMEHALIMSVPLYTEVNIGENWARTK